MFRQVATKQQIIDQLWGHLLCVFSVIFTEEEISHKTTGWIEFVTPKEEEEEEEFCSWMEIINSSLRVLVNYGAGRAGKVK